mgnify:FL=1
MAKKMFIGNNVNLMTPCIGTCELDEQDICTGCYRSSSEIIDWINKSEDEKIDIVIRCKKMIAQRSNK